MMDRPLMLFDRDCGFCRRWIARWRNYTGDRVDYEALQSAGERFPDLPPDELARAVHLVESDGTVTRGAEAVFRALAHGGRHWPLSLYEHLPLFAPFSERLYALVARHRSGANRVTTLLWGAHVVPPGETRTVSLFVRAMGVIFAIAFVSLWVQVIGLVGAGGILPAREFLEAVREHVGAERYWFLPTVFWMNASDVALHGVCALGLLCSLSVVAGFAPAGALLGAWFAYLSLLGVGQDFLRFQWDSLLLEAGMVAVLLAPWRARLRGAGPPPRAALWLARWLLFRLMVTSAIVKLGSGDPTWRNLTALDYHYFTQPLPPWTAWYMQELPSWFQKLSVLFMYLCEGIAPFLIWGPRRVRFAGAALMAALQVLILVTGNYGFFNLLAFALLIPLLDDGLWMRRTPAEEEAMACGIVPEAPLEFAPAAPRSARGGVAVCVIAAVIFVATLIPLAGALHIDTRRAHPVSDLYRMVAPFNVANRYGLFAVMTTDRPEIVIEGSRDGVEWKPYEFRYKMGDPSRRPRFTTPHMPRLDWLMWFAALGDVRENRWFLILCWRILQGSPGVQQFFVTDPFPGDPPRYLRANVYMYTFTTPAERRATGAWWKRTLRGPYVRNLMLQDGQLTTAPEAVGP